MFPATKRISTGELLVLKPTLKPEEHYLNDVLLNDENRVFKLFQLDTNDFFGISAIGDERLILKQVLADPVKHGTYLHTINGMHAPLNRVYAVANKYPLVNKIPISNVSPCKHVPHGRVNYLLTINNKGKVRLARNLIYDVPVMLQMGF